MIILLYMAKVKNLLNKLKLKLSSLFLRFKSLSRKKKILIIIVVIIVSAIFIKIINDYTKDPGYVLATAEIGNIEEVVSETGNIATNNRTDIHSPTNGIVTQMFVENGQFVEKEDVLFEVQSSATEQEKNAAQSNYLTAVNSLNTSRSTKDSLQATMFSEWQAFQDIATSDRYENSDGSPRDEERAASEFHIAQKDWIAAEKKFNDQVTAIAQGQADASSKKLLLDATKDAVVKATADGIVENVSASVGSSVSINQILAPVGPVMTIVGSAATEVSLKLGESDVVKVKNGQEVVLDVSAVNDKEYKGTVTRVDSVGTDEAGVIKYSAYIMMLDPDKNIRPGMSVDVDIKTNSLENVLIVPNSAVKPYKGGRAVRIVSGPKKEIEFIPVKIGIRGPTHTEILEGIKEGQIVVTALSNDSIDRPSLF